jgi:hypothetical protein
VCRSQQPAGQFDERMVEKGCKIIKDRQGFLLPDKASSPWTEQ